jgi:addiction module HigA family antidote
MMMSNSSTATDQLDPIHPGEILLEDFIKGFEITQNKLAVAIGVPPRRINEIVHGKRRITADTALRLGKYFGVSPEFWMNLQAHYDLRIERRNLAAIEAIQPLGPPDSWRLGSDLLPVMARKKSSRDRLPATAGGAGRSEGSQ